MIIKTRDYGEIKAEEKDIIRFTKGMYGFEDYTDYLILKDNPEDDIMYLQSIDNKELSFVLVDPYYVFNTYKPILNEEDLSELKVNLEIELKFLVIAIIRDEIQNSVINLKSPIAINPELKIAKQVILQNTYPLRCPLFSTEEDI
ncbi:flagellar assembly protein FliW [Sedimentibacter sp. MB31-C6]|uniref:flagellar assembly protein FliW n=1 Tax=Sedimentibacter sp. MB31-C6 TaxID=3109366 RepID=UPI002DDCBEC6|nr:flagellar assembly protein FliW [Sedimentibacter sp. MB36-C1]WSI05001.1 flagellar assembly protein FliW [Sedimentibacter sp. MB36-C1]